MISIKTDRYELAGTKLIDNEGFGISYTITNSFSQQLENTYINAGAEAFNNYILSFLANL